jgi:hypothetical protein
MSEVVLSYSLSTMSQVIKYNLERESFQSVPEWITFVKNIESPLIVLVGNKLDLER